MDMRKHLAWMGVVLMAGGAHAQTLEHRKPGADGAPVVAQNLAKSAQARQSLPEGAEGDYRWRETGEVIQLYIEDDALHGYLTRRSEQHSTSSAPMTFDFLQSDTAGGRVQFVTSHIHGEWYSFSGHIARGVAVAPGREGDYLLQGVLQIHVTGDTAADVPVARMLNAKRGGAGR
jgi:hypothetical protein